MFLFYVAYLDRLERKYTVSTLFLCFFLNFKYYLKVGLNALVVLKVVTTDIKLI